MEAVEDVVEHLLEDVAAMVAVEAMIEEGIAEAMTVLLVVAIVEDTGDAQGGMHHTEIVIPKSACMLLHWDMGIAIPACSEKQSLEVLGRAEACAWQSWRFKT